MTPEQAERIIALLERIDAKLTSSRAWGAGRNDETLKRLHLMPQGAGRMQHSEGEV